MTRLLLLSTHQGQGGQGGQDNLQWWLSIGGEDLLGISSSISNSRGLSSKGLHSIMVIVATVGVPLPLIMLGSEGCGPTLFGGLSNQLVYWWLLLMAIRRERREILLQHDGGQTYSPDFFSVLNLLIIKDYMKVATPQEIVVIVRKYIT